MTAKIRTHLPHIVIPPNQWPRKKVYYYCPDCRSVFGLAKAAPPVCPDCKRAECKDIFGEIALRLQHAWKFFEATRYEKGKWGLFRMSPSDKDYTLWASLLALGTYGELRCLGFELPQPFDDDKILNEWVNAINSHIDPETNLLKGPLGVFNTAPLVNSAAYVSGSYAWGLNNRVFMPEHYQPPAGTHTDIDHLRNEAAALNFLEDRNPEYGSWTKNPYGKGSWTTRVIKNHIDLLKAKELPDDGMADFVRQWLDKKQDPNTGAWGGEQCSSHPVIVNGIFKVFVSYERYGWPIQYKKEIVDFVLSGASQNQGFGGSGCSVFDPMMVLGVIRSRGIDYRADEIDEVVAKTFLTFLENWDENHSWFKGNNWNGKHNMGIVLYMAALLLDQPYMKISTIYNWRDAPIIERKKDGTVIVNQEITYSKPGFPFILF